MVFICSSGWLLVSLVYSVTELDVVLSALMCRNRCVGTDVFLFFVFEFFSLHVTDLIFLIIAERKKEPVFKLAD